MYLKMNDLANIMKEINLIITSMFYLLKQKQNHI